MSFEKMEERWIYLFSFSPNFKWQVVRHLHNSRTVSNWEGGNPLSHRFALHIQNNLEYSTSTRREQSLIAAEDKAPPSLSPKKLYLSSLSYKASSVAVYWYYLCSLECFFLLNHRRILVLIPCNYWDHIISESLENLHIMCTYGWIHYEDRIINSVHKKTIE